MLQSLSDGTNRSSRVILLAFVLTAIFLVFGFSERTAHAADAPVTIPALQQWNGSTGNYTFSSSSRIVVNSAYSTQLAATGAVFADDLLKLTGFTIQVVTASSANAGDIFLTMGTTDSALKFDGYLMDVTDRITINGKDKGGTFYGTRTVLQLLKQSYTIARGSAKDWSNYAERTLLVDNGRKYFSPTYLKNQIRELAYLKYNIYQWHISDNEGFRIESTVHPEFMSSQYLTKAEVADIIDFAADYNVTIVPQIDMPAHMGQILSQHPELQLEDVNGVKNTGKIDLSLPAAYTLMEDILDEFIPLFPGPYYHIAADEYLKGNEYLSYPQLQAYAQANYGPNATGLETYLGYVNWANDIIKSYGKITRMSNDGIQNSTIVPLDTDIQVEHWVQSYLTPQELINRGHTLINANDKYLYYVLGTTWKPSAAEIYQSFTPNVYFDATLSPTEPKNLGPAMCIWADYNVETETQVELGIQNALRSLAQKGWGSPVIASDYATFLPMIRAVGNAPGYTGGSSFSKAVKLSEGKPVTASSFDTAAFTPDKAFDGNFNTRWASGQTDNEWIQVDLGAVYNITDIFLNWEVAYAKVYEIQVSNDGSDWTTIYGTTAGTSGYRELTNLKGVGRYVRMQGIQRAFPQYGYSIYEFQVLGTSANLALGKKATASSEETIGNMVAGKAVDGHAGTRWSSLYSDPQWLQVDLGAVYNINRVVLKWELSHATAYQIQVSNDQVNWTTIYSTTTGTGGTQDLAGLSGSGRYIRINGTQRANSSPGWGYSLYEFEVYGPNLAEGRPATASSTDGTAFVANYAVDGDGSTRWASLYTDPQWLQVDLGVSRTINRVVVNWETAYAKSYSIQVSNDAVNWTTIYSTTNGTGGSQNLTGLSGSGRYVRMLGTQKATNLPGWGYSIYELQVYGS